MQEVDLWIRFYEGVKMTMQENKSVICDLIESGSSGDWHRLEDLVAEDYVDHCKWKNREGLIQTFRTFREVYPDCTSSDNSDIWS